MLTNQSAILVGATGLVGSQILKILLSDPAFKSVKTITRRPLHLDNPKLCQKVLHFDQTEIMSSEIKGTVAFSALGTTLKQAGSFEEQRLVDFEYQLNVAKAAKANGVKTFVLISALGANAKSFFPYNRMKGELEEEIKKLKFETLILVRPSLLQGHRNESRLIEELSGKLLQSLPRFKGLEMLRPTSGERVAKAAVKAMHESGPGVYTLLPKDIWV